MRALSKIIKRDRDKFKIPRMVQDIAPILVVWKDGIFMVGKGMFSITLRFSDVN